MIKINNKLKAAYFVIFSGILLLTSCNKELEQLAIIPTPTYPTGSGIAGAIAANPNDSLYNRLLIKSGLAATLNNNANSYTMFIPDNAGMRIFITAISGGAVPPTAPDAVFSGFISANIPAATAAGIVSYNTVGQRFLSGSFPTTFPNYPLPTLIILDPNLPFVRMPIFPSKRAAFSYVNNIPLTAVDQAASNGIIHHTFTIVAPPTATLKTMIAAVPTLSYFRAAIARGDSGSVGLSRFDSLLNYGVTNMTVLAPNDAAMQPVLFGSIYGALLAMGVPAATAAAQATALSATPGGFNLLPVASVRGIAAYHILASLTTSTTTPFQPNIRAFSVNFPATPGFFVKTLVNGAVAVHPGIMAQATFTGPAVTTLRFTGLGTFPPGGAPYSGTAATAVTMDRHAVNGVFHIINGVLLPQ